MSALDEDLIGAMDQMFIMLRPLIPDISDESLRCIIVSTNLRGLAEGLLQIDDREVDTGVVDLKQTALGLLGTADWLKGDLVL